MSKYFDILAYLMGKQAGGGGGGEAVLIDKTISTNGTYNASSDNADGYKKAVVNVPNSYAAGDEGKVVHNGELVSQTAHAEVNSNGTIDTTLNNSVVVNVSGGGGGYGYTKLAEADFTVNTSSTSDTSLGTISAGASAYTSNKMVFVRVRDKAGRRDGYLYGSDCIFANPNPKDGSITSFSIYAILLFAVKGTGGSNVSTTKAGVYAKSIASNGDISVCAKYNSSYGTINGTYHVEVYLLDWPDGVSPFAT